MGKFKIPPLTTLVGSTLTNFFRVLRQGKPVPSFYPKLFVTFLIILISVPCQLFDKVYFYFVLKKIRFREPPVFIIGHWRSGTTFLHNLLCQDPDAAFITTYHSLFPSNLKSKWLFKTFMKLGMPNKRPSDNVLLSASFPQEDEFALCNLTPYSFYMFFLFPSKYKEFYMKYVRFEDVPLSVTATFTKYYSKLLAQALHNSGERKRVVVKNPANTGRIHVLSKIFPGARFVYIYRNPVLVFLSTKKFFEELLPTLYLRKISEQEIEEMIFDLYKIMLKDYEWQKGQIPKGNLFEVRFEDFEKDPRQSFRNIYDIFGIEISEDITTKVDNYLASQENYNKNRYTIKRSVLDRVIKEWGFAMERYNYSIPGSVEVIDDLPETAN